MATVEYLSGLPRREGVAPVEVTVDQQVLRLKHGGFLRGWSYQLPLATITSVELATTQEVRAKGILPPGGATLPEQAQDYFLAIDAPLGDRALSVILRGSWTVLEHLRQDILKGRMRASKQWEA